MKGGGRDRVGKVRMLRVQLGQGVGMEKRWGSERHRASRVVRLIGVEGGGRGKVYATSKRMRFGKANEMKTRLRRH